MSDSLRKKAIHGFWWSLIDWCSVNGIQFVIGVVLARLLLPEQFGLIGMLAIFIAVAQTFLEGGFGAALVQDQNTNQVDQSSIFYFNIVIGAMGAGLLCLAAPSIAAFYREPLLTPLCRVLSLNILINSLGVVQTALMTKQVDFRTQAKISVASSVVSGTIGITMAMRGYGVWSLAAQSLSANACRNLLLWLLNSWRPSLTFSYVALRRMFAYGSRLLASNLLETVFQNMYLLVLGKMFSATSLGLYTRANSLQQLPAKSLYAMVGRVTFPVFAAVQDNTERMKRGLRKTLSSLVLINFPVMIGLALVSEPLVAVLFGSKWLPCVPYMQILCIAGMLYPLHAANVNVLLALGRSDLVFRLEIPKKTLFVLGIAIGCHWGIEGVIWSQAIVSALVYFLNSYYTGRLLSYPAREQIADILPYLAASLVMGVAVYAVQLVGVPGNVALLLSQVLVGAFTYWGFCWAFRLAAFLEITDLVFGILSRRYVRQ